PPSSLPGGGQRRPTAAAAARSPPVAPFNDRGQQVVAVLPIRVDRSRDEIEAERRAGTQRSKLKTRMIIAVGLALEVVGVDQQNRSACSARQCARLLIDRIAKRLDRLANLFTRLGPNILFVVQHARDGNSCNTSRLR